MERHLDVSDVYDLGIPSISSSNQHRDNVRNLLIKMARRGELEVLKSNLEIINPAIVID